MTPFFFGSKQQLLGMLHHARGRKAGAHRTVVICPPIGHEYIRSHWCLRLLARQLTRKGINVLRFDYRGIGDSAGTNQQTTALDQWHQDVHTAIDCACTKTGCRNVMLLGLRYGGTIASAVASQSDKVSSLVLWEPVIDPVQYLRSLRAIHKQMIDLWACRIKTLKDETHEEILGSIYNRGLLAEIENTGLDLDSIDQPQFIVDSYDRRGRYTTNEMQRFMPTDDEDSWSVLKMLETGWLRASTSRQIVLMADEMFRRLEQFEQLGPYSVGPLDSPSPMMPVSTDAFAPASRAVN